MNFSKKISIAAITHLSTFCLLMIGGARGDETPIAPNPASKPLIKTQPEDQFRGHCDAGDFFEAIQLFQNSTMQYKIMFVYDFIKKPSNSPELDFLFLDYLKETNESDDEGSETRDARLVSMVELFAYFSQKYEITLTPPNVDPRRRDPRWDIKRKFAAGIQIIEKVLETRLPEHGKKPAEPVQAADPSAPKLARKTEDGTGPSSSSERTPPPTWTISIVLIAGALVLIPSIRFPRSKHRRVQ